MADPAPVAQTFFMDPSIEQNCKLDVRKNHEFWIETKECCVENKELCIKSKEFCIKNDEFCRPSSP